MKYSPLHTLVMLAVVVTSFGQASAAEPKAAKPKPPVLTCKTAATDGLTYTVIKAGKGEKPGAESKVKVTYRGNLKADGTQFDEGRDVEFKIGGVIKGFGQGLQLMQPGGKYRLCIPSAIGYGESGTGPIPANADLVFEVELLSFTNPPPKPVIAQAERACANTTASGLGYTAIKTGTGKVPTDTDVVLMDFTTFDPATGVTEEKGEWEKIPLSQMTSLFGEGVKLMPAGSSYLFCFPQDPAATEPLRNIIVDLIDVRPAPPPAW